LAILLRALTVWIKLSTLSYITASNQHCCQGSTFDSGNAIDTYPYSWPRSVDHRHTNSTWSSLGDAIPHKASRTLSISPTQSRPDQVVSKSRTIFFRDGICKWSINIRRVSTSASKWVDTSRGEYRRLNRSLFKLTR
jgi:hypothetical protein